MRKRKLADRGAQETGTIYNQPLSRFFGRIAYLFILSLFWLATSWPIFTIGASTTALFYVCFRMWRREEGGLWKTYIRSFKENFRQATFIWMLYLFIVLDVCLVGYSLYHGGALQLSDFSYQDGKYYSALVIVCLVYMSIMLYTAGLLATFRQTTGQCIWGAITMAFGCLPSTILFLLVVWLLYIVTMNLFPPLALIDVPLAVWIISWRMNKLFARQIERAEKRAAGGEGQG